MKKYLLCALLSLSLLLSACGGAVEQGIESMTSSFVPEENSSTPEESTPEESTPEEIGRAHV